MSTHSCDRCNASARVIVRRAANEELAFCGHHYHQHEFELIKSDWRVVSDTREPAPTNS